MQDFESIQIELRKNRDTLKIVGKGVILFGTWTLVRAVLYDMTQWESIGGQFEGIQEGSRRAGLIFYVLISFILYGFDIALRLFVGRSAIAEGRGERRRAGFIFVGFLMAMSNLLLIIAIVKLGGEAILQEPVMAVSLVIEGTAMIMMLEMCIAAIRVRKLQKQLKELG